MSVCVWIWCFTWEKYKMNIFTICFFHFISFLVMRTNMMMIRPMAIWHHPSVEPIWSMDEWMNGWIPFNFLSVWPFVCLSVCVWLPNGDFFFISINICLATVGRLSFLFFSLTHSLTNTVIDSFDEKQIYICKQKKPLSKKNRNWLFSRTHSWHIFFSYCYRFFGYWPLLLVVSFKGHTL